MKLSKDNLYIQARNAIIKMINDNLEFMSKLPSEKELSETLSISRNTVREAIKSLERDGILASRHGIGTFIIRDPKSIKHNISVLESITMIISNHGYTPGTQSINFERRKTSSKALKIVAQKLNVPEILYIDRVRTANKIPVIFVEDYIPYVNGMYERYSSEDNESIFDFLKSYDSKISFSDCTISAVLADKKIQEKLSLKSPSPILKLEQIHYTVKGIPALYSTSYFVSDKFDFNIIRKFTE